MSGEADRSDYFTWGEGIEILRPDGTPLTKRGHREDHAESQGEADRPQSPATGDASTYEELKKTEPNSPEKCARPRRV